MKNWLDFDIISVINFLSRGVFMLKRINETKRVEEYTCENSDHIGKTFYVCDFRRSVNQERAFRDLKPTKAVLITQKQYQEEIDKINENADSKKNILAKKIYFSENVFVSLDKNGELNGKKHIPIFDNTGHSARDSHALFVFETEKEARKKYNELLDDYISNLEDELRMAEARIENKISEAKEKRYKI